MQVEEEEAVLHSPITELDAGTISVGGPEHGEVDEYYLPLHSSIHISKNIFLSCIDIIYISTMPTTRHPQLE